MKGSFYTGNYTNLFEKMGYSNAEITERLNQIFQTMFYDEEERIYYPVGEDMGYITDTGNNDVRTEGMSYGMMMCVQLNKKEEFDRLWKWTKTYMWMSGEAGISEDEQNISKYAKEALIKNKGYFAWSCALDGKKNSYGPAPDGEEYFAMALFFASNRFGDGEGIYNYKAEARAILHECIHKGEDGNGGEPMWDPSNKLIKFVPNLSFTDPSYHLPHFYELFALWADEGDREFFKEAASCSRAYMKKACHEDTGLAAEYADYDGKPHKPDRDRPNHRHDWYYSDAYRVALNLALDYEWFRADEWECLDKLQRFFMERADMQDLRIYEIDGTQLDEPALHPTAIIATNAAASLATYKNGKYWKELAELFYNTPLRKGNRRYYDNCLYIFAFMALSGNYKIIM